jgi:hypothetical protein
MANVIPSFSAFAKGPDLAGARHNALSLIESARQANASIALQRQKLAQDAQMANMQFQAAQENMRGDAMRRASQLAIDKAYKEAVIGLKERGLSMAEAQAEQQAQAAAQTFAAQQEYRKMIEGGMDSNEALQRVGSFLPPQTVSALARTQQQQEPPLGQRIDIEGTNRFGVRSGPQTMTLVNPDEGRSRFDEDLIKGEISDLRMEIRNMKRIRDNPRSFLTDEERADYDQQIAQLQAELNEKTQAARGGGQPAQGGGIRILGIERE